MVIVAVQEVNRLISSDRKTFRRICCKINMGLVRKHELELELCFIKHRKMNFGMICTNT